MGMMNTAGMYRNLEVEGPVKGFHLHNGQLAKYKLKGYPTCRSTTIMEKQTLKRNPDFIRLCAYGLHFSKEPLQACRKAPASMEFISLVEGSGRVIEDKNQLVASERTCLLNMSQEEVCEEIIEKHFKRLNLKGFDGKKHRYSYSTR